MMALLLGACLLTCKKESALQPTVSDFQRDSARVARLALYTATAFINSDSSLSASVGYKAFNKEGREVKFDQIERHIQLYMDGKPQPNRLSFQSPGTPGVIKLQARLFNSINSNDIGITIRPSKPYPLIRLPLIVHVPKSLSRALSGVDLTKVIAQVNAIFRNRIKSKEPNQADAYIEFFLATTAPDGTHLEEAGRNQLNFDEPASLAEVKAKVDSVTRRWCPQQYVNVFMKMDWIRKYPAGYSYVASVGDVSAVPQQTDYTCGPISTYLMGRGVMLSTESSMGSLTHELGHYLGLPHTFDAGCGSNRMIFDTPAHAERKGNPRLSCEGVPFWATNPMDYYNDREAFTQDQVAFMRSYLSRNPTIPGYQKGRLSALDINELSIGCKPDLH